MISAHLRSAWNRLAAGKPPCGMRYQPFEPHQFAIEPGPAMQKVPTNGHRCSTIKNLTGLKPRLQIYSHFDCLLCMEIMRRILQIFLIILTAILFTGCAIVTKQAYVPSITTPIKNVLVVTQNEITPLRFAIYGSKATLFGPFGVMAAISEAEEKTGLLRKDLNQYGASYDKHFADELKASFAKAGIQTSFTTAKKETRRGFIEDYSSLPVSKDTDAVLDLFIFEASYGGAHPMTDAEMRPIMQVYARLVSAKTFEILYSDHISYGYDNPLMDAQKIKAPSKYYMPDMEAVIADKARSAEGIRSAAAEVARFLANQFTVTAVKASR